MKVGDFKIFKEWKNTALAEQLRTYTATSNTHTKLMLISRECGLKTAKEKKSLDGF